MMGDTPPISASQPHRSSTPRHISWMLEEYPGILAEDPHRQHDSQRIGFDRGVEQLCAQGSKR
jgi:hypothetical protein